MKNNSDSIVTNVAYWLAQGSLLLAALSFVWFVSDNGCLYGCKFDKPDLLLKELAFFIWVLSPLPAYAFRNYRTKRQRTTFWINLGGTFICVPVSLSLYSAALYGYPNITGALVYIYAPLLAWGLWIILFIVTKLIKR